MTRTTASEGLIRSARQAPDRKEIVNEFIPKRESRSHG